MSLTNSYLLKTSTIEDFFNTIQTARAPETFTHKFLKDLDFKSSNDRLFIGVLKGMLFLDEDGVPTDRYFDFLDQSQAGQILADGIRDAYDDLFAIRTDANEMDIDDIRGKLRTLTQGQKSDNVINNMASTFRSLCDLADWDEAPTTTATAVETPEENSSLDDNPPQIHPPLHSGNKGELQLHYNIQLILPESRDPKVYDALFASLRRHLY